MSSTWETPDTETEEQIEERRHIVSDTVRRLEKLAQNWTAAELRGVTTYLPREHPDRRLRRDRATRFHADQGPVTPSFRVRGPAVRVLRAGRDGGALLGGAATDTGVAARAADVWTVYDPRGEPHVVPCDESISTLLIYLLVDFSPPDLAIPSKPT